ncbi:sterol uptake control protein 2 [Colletotrichum liriopes]|uniref:Sterol uptake control protein 2 n=1 Tax=Colletotrichum liriopes TaxID=708192 RepID=A0AA37GZI2_9PEZI|nr:sterol uptake control protein 2 [Colletotrichum liriopes]
MPNYRSSTPPGDASLPLRFVSSIHPEPKKKVAHKKSRGGCISCKKRKVKCDELYPCKNCLRRNETCVPSPKTLSPEAGDSPPARRPFDTSGSVNLLHMELFHHFQHVTIPTLCFPEIWPSVLPLAFKEEYLMTAMLAVSARHLSILRPQETTYAEAAMALLSRSCSIFSTVLDRSDKYDPLFFTAQLIQYLTWSNLEFLKVEGGPDSSVLDLSRDQLFLLSSGVRVFLSSTRAHGSDSIFTRSWQSSQCDALDLIVTEQGMDRDSLVEGFMKRYDELTPGESPNLDNQVTCMTEKDAERASFRGIVNMLSVILALWKHRETNTRPSERSDLERYILAFPLFCFGPFLDMIVANDSRALLVLYHFYNTSQLLLADEATWWASGRMKAMSHLIKQELARRRLETSVVELAS